MGPNVCVLMFFRDPAACPVLRLPVDLTGATRRVPRKRRVDPACRRACNCVVVRVTRH